MNNVFLASIPLSVSAITIGTFPVNATNFNSSNSNLDFPQMFVWGDSLSDPGNAFSVTGGLFPDSSVS